MSWQWVPSNRRRRKKQARHFRRAYSNAYEPKRQSRDDADMHGDGADENFDGFYDRRGNRVNVIQTPSDMLPPSRAAREANIPGWPTNRYGYRSRF